RQAAKFYDADGADWNVLNDGGGKGFAGYDMSEGESRVMRWRLDDKKAEFVLEQTPLYAESGGEIADHGRIEGNGFAVDVTDVQKVNGIIHHYGELASGDIALGADDSVKITVDVARRAKKTIHHTATHLLQAALNEVVGEHVEQKGSVVEPDRLRFDYSHGKPLSDEEIIDIETWVNARIRRNDDVVVADGVSLDEAKAQGVVALFGEKYGDSVRTVKAGPESFELCGGNHVSRTGDIGHLRITVETGVAAGVRRIEAVVGHAADAVAREERALIARASTALKTDPTRLEGRVSGLLDEIKTLKKALDKARRGGGGADIDSLIDGAADIDGVPLISAKVDVDARETLMALVDRLRDKQPGSVIVLGAELDGAV
ncbi:MAG: alanine--tRNA ligase-related protein, partial [Acidimicrobiales bacterium]|nr:alanine--tRNA ligase-related protein [Acidimicrobiales bacterium]